MMRFYDFGEIIKKDTRFCIFGIPWDYLTSIDLPNSAIAPKEIRKVTNNLALTTEMGSEIPSLPIVDLGDINIEKMNVEQNLKEIDKFIKRIYNQKSDIIPVMIGGDHFCSYPVIKAIGDKFNDKKKIGILIFDSHLDLYHEWDKGVYSHATITHRVLDLPYFTNRNIMVLGTRDIDIPEMKIAQDEKIKYFNSFYLEEIGFTTYFQEVKRFFKNSEIESLYVSIDIDALDPSVAQATGYAIPGGFTYREMWKFLRTLTKEFSIIGFDLVEVAPNLDTQNRITCNLAAKLIIEFISFIDKRGEF
ncbi:MAG: arginase family protein [Candidatus Lokiarchaeota archaeon]